MEKETEHLITTLRMPNSEYVNIDTCFIDHTGWCGFRGFCQYETIVMSSDKYGRWHKKNELDVAQYKTWDEAKLGHEAMIKKWENGNQ